jgi:hypothetical protein
MAERRFVGYYGVASAPGGVTNRAAIAARVARSRTRGRLYSCDTILQIYRDAIRAAVPMGKFVNNQVTGSTVAYRAEGRRRSSVVPNSSIGTATGNGYAMLSSGRAMRSRSSPIPIAGITNGRSPMQPGKTIPHPWT